MDILPIDQAIHLKNHLSKDRIARIRYHQLGTGQRQPGAVNIDNHLLQQMQTVEMNTGSAVEDVLYGLAQSNGNGRPLNVGYLFVILQCMEVINSRQVQLALQVSQRQAQKYVQTVRVALPFLTKLLHQEATDGQKQKDTQKV